MEDTRLVHALQNRQNGAMERFQTAYTPLLRYIIAPILPDERDREECLSDVLLQVWDSIGTFDPTRATLTTWLTHLARNAALNRRRGNEHRREGGTLDEAMPDAADGPEQSLLKAEAARVLWAAVERLGRRDRELFLRKYYYYQPTAQIAAESGLTVRAVEGKLYRIRKHLQSELGGVFHG
ncbi:RNA polymerase sigma factor [Oscillibacter sp. 1-3]|uniref:RNA polymerase sigma factor n=1 Tax=Oscillibacter sp. 1-3 TaxID=1235797 RepID=UPI000335EA55|nr:sigma-70 family RNA polymerase sigma factor [Oscillibacter sp. 1-3]EOS63031.1 sigma-70 family RNA polymerase sigma factor [Oscillibacter sp. 1-3]